MWTWIFGIGFLLAAAAAVLFARGSAFWMEANAFWKKAHDETGSKLRRAEEQLFDVLRAYCRDDFRRREDLGVDITVAQDGDSWVARGFAAPVGSYGECWLFGADLRMKDGREDRLYAWIEAAPCGESVRVFRTVEWGTDPHRRASWFIDEARRCAGKALTKTQAERCLAAFFGIGGEQKLKGSIHVPVYDHPSPRREGFPSLDDPMDDMD
jgi:hypothetical protein